VSDLERDLQEIGADVRRLTHARVHEGMDVSEFDAETWQPLPLLDAASSSAPVTPDHGRGLVYGRGAVTLVSSEPGVGKSMILTAIAADAAAAGLTVLYLDFERTAELLLERLRAAGLSDEEIRRVHYLRPREPASRAGIAAMVERLAPALVALDSYDAALALFGLEAKNEDVRIFASTVIEPLRSNGAPVLISDHVPKDRERRGRYSIGGQAKLALAEAHLGLSAVVPLRRGTEGKLRIRVLKDTYGYLPPAAVFTLRSHETSGALSWDVNADEEEEDDAGSFRPTGLMERVSRALEISGGDMTRSELRRTVKGKGDYVLLAIDTLIREEYAEETEGPRGARPVRLLRPFREADE
jgi:hypothetical protein